MLICTLPRGQYAFSSIGDSAPIHLILLDLILTETVDLLDHQLLDRERKFGDRRVLKEPPQRQLDLKGVVDPIDDLGGQERMPSQGKEVIVDADRVMLEHLA